MSSINSLSLTRLVVMLGIGFFPKVVSFERQSRISAALDVLALCCLGLFWDQARQSNLLSLFFFQFKYKTGILNGAAYMYGAVAPG